MTFLPTDNLGNVTTSDNSFTLSTGSKDRAVSSLGLFTAGDREFLKPLGTEGSAATIGNLNIGVYQFNWSMLSKDKNGWDKLYVWNGKELTLLGDRSLGNQISSARWTHDDTAATVDVIYDFVTFIAVNENSKTGTTEFTIDEFDYLQELSYEAPTPITLTPTFLLGDVDLKDGYTSIGTGGGDRAMSSLSLELTGDRNALNLGTEGSLARWEVENGTYEVTYKVYSSEDQSDRDKIYYWEDGVMEILAERSQAIQTSATRYQTDWMTSEVEVRDGQLTFMAVDEVDKSGTTQLRIRGIEKIASAEEEVIGVEYDTVPDDGMGAIANNTLSTGNGAVSAATLTSDFFHGSVNISQYGTEGTAALWVTEPGLNRITWSVSSTENDLHQDQFLLWDGEKLFKLGDRSIATTYNEELGIYESDLITTTVETVSDEWGILALDTDDVVGDSVITIHELQWLETGEAATLEAPDTYLLPDPDPEPIVSVEQETVGMVGTYDNFIDPIDTFIFPLGYNDGLEGFIDVVSGGDLTVNIYDSEGGLYDSMSLGLGDDGFGFNFQSDSYSIEITPNNLNEPTEYYLVTWGGQVYDPY